MNTNDDDVKLISVQAKAPGKVIISGEHAVVYGKPALCFSIDKYTTCIGVLSALVSYALASNGNDVRCGIDLGAGFGYVAVYRYVTVFDFFLRGAS